MATSLELSADERQLLVDVLTNRLSELRQEIYHSTVSTYTEQLKKTEAQLQAIVGRLKSAGPEES